MPAAQRCSTSSLVSGRFSYPPPLLLSPSLSSCPQVHRRFKQQHSCLPAGRYHDVLGLRRLYDVFTAVLSQTLPLYSERLFARHGGLSTVPVRDLGVAGFMTRDPRNIQYMLTHLYSYGFGRSREALEYFLGGGIFTLDGAAWSHSRSLIRPAFTRNQIADLELLEGCVQEFFSTVDAVRVGGEEEEEVDLMPLVHDLTMDFASCFLFGESCGAMAQRREGREEGLAYWFDMGMKHVTLSMSFAGLHWIWRPKMYRRARAFVHAYVDGCISRAETRYWDEKKDVEKEKYVFIHALLEEMQDRQALRAEVLNLLLAGRDTTAALISWMMWTLGREPEVMRKLREEIEDTLHGGVPQWQQLKDMKYLQAVIHESTPIPPPPPLPH